MSEVKKIATRESYGNALVELGAEHDNLIVLDADLAAATKTGVFKKAYPDRHIDCGIAECNMMGIAAGLSTTGIVPFASTFAMFAAGRTYIVDGIVHYAVANIPGAVPYTSTLALTNATLPYVTALADKGWQKACEDDPALAKGLNIVEGKVVYKAVADVFGISEK